MRLKDKTALIAGVGRNIGKAIALTFAREGAALILVDKVGDDLEQIAKECECYGVHALPLLADLGNHDEANHAAELGLRRFDKVDLLMCVAGIRPHKPIWEFGYDEWHHACSNCHRWNR